MQSIISRSRMVGIILVFSFLIHLSATHLSISPVTAAEYGWQSSITLRETYDSNVNLKNVDDFEHRVAPSLSFAAVTDKAELQASASYDITRYQQRDELDTTDQYYQIITGLAASPLLSLDFTGTYVIDYTFESALEEEGVIAERNKRKRAAANPSFTLNFTPRDRLRTEYELYNTQYHRTSERDYTGHDVSLAWLHDLKNERSTLKFLLGVNQTDYREDEDNPGEEIRDRTVRGVFGLTHRFTETTGLECSAGARFTESTIRDGDDTTDQSGSFIGNAVFTWQYERSTVRALLSRDYQPSTLGGGGTRDAARLTLSHRFTERLSAAITPAYSRTDREKEESPDVTTWSFSVAPSVRYRITPSVVLSTGYSFVRVDRGAEAQDQSDTRNRVWIGLTWNIHEPEWTVRPPKPLVEWPHRY